MKSMPSLRKSLFRRMQTRYGRVYILPTGYGGYFIVIIFILFIISLSYGHSLAFASTFLFVALVMTSTIHTHFNLKDVGLKNAWIAEFVGADSSFTIETELQNLTTKKKFDLQIKKGKKESKKKISLGPGESGSMALTLPGLPRGRYRLESLTLGTTFPFGLFFSWSYANADLDFIVHPKKAAVVWNDLFESGDSFEDSGHFASGDQDFEGHSHYQDGEPLGRIDWRVYARRNQLLKKNFISPVDKEIMVTSTMINHLGLEKGLEYMCGLLYLAYEKGWRFGIDWNGNRIAPQAGRKQLKECLDFIGGIEKEVVDL